MYCDCFYLDEKNVEREEFQRLFHCDGCYREKVLETALVGVVEFLPTVALSNVASSKVAVSTPSIGFTPTTISTSIRSSSQASDWAWDAWKSCCL